MLRISNVMGRWGCVLALGCGAAPPASSSESSGTAARASGDEGGSPPDTLAVSGLRGTLSQREIQGALEPKLPKFLRCVQQRLGELDVLGGTISFSFHIATNGQVASVQPTSSTLGDREAERCMLQIAEATRFPEPHGGEADFVWPLEIPVDAEVRAPVELSPDSLRKVLAERGAALQASCGGGQVIVTAYVDPDGRVLAAGAAAPDLATPAQLDCVSAGVRAWQLASPGSYVAKVSFSLP